MGLADTCKALSDPVRRNLMELLKNGRMNAGELAVELNVTPAALSYHLNLMKKAELVMEYRQKNFIYYELDCTLLDEMILWLSQFEKLGDKTSLQEER